MPQYFETQEHCKEIAQYQILDVQMTVLIINPYTFKSLQSADSKYNKSYGKDYKTLDFITTT